MGVKSLRNNETIILRIVLFSTRIRGGTPQKQSVALQSVFEIAPLQSEINFSQWLIPSCLSPLSCLQRAVVGDAGLVEGNVGRGESREGGRRGGRAVKRVALIGAWVMAFLIVVWVAFEATGIDVGTGSVSYFPSWCPPRLSP